MRDTTEGKTNFLNVLFGPMLRRWAEHLTKGREKYPDPEPGVPNWTLAQGKEEYLRAKESAFRHFLQWLQGERDEDHAAAVIFNINLAEYVLENVDAGEIPPGLGATTDDGTRPQPADACNGVHEVTHIPTMPGECVACQRCGSPVCAPGPQVWLG